MVIYSRPSSSCGLPAAPGRSKAISAPLGDLHGGTGVASLPSPAVCICTFTLPGPFQIEDLLQLGSADGTEFATLVAECGGGDEAAVQRTLDRLAADGAIYTIGTKYHPM